MSSILRSDGNPVELVPTLKWKGYTFPIRVLNEKVIQVAEPKPLIAALALQLSDKDNLLWAGLMSLACDIYNRNPNGSTEFLDFVKAIGLNLTDGNGKRIDVQREIEKAMGQHWKVQQLPPDSPKES